MADTDDRGPREGKEEAQGRPRICQCGCGEPIPPNRWHKYRPPRFINGHYHRWQQANRPPDSAWRVPPGTLCACGCGEPIAEFHPGGRPRYSRTKSGRFYLPYHRHRGVKGAANPSWRGGKIVNNHGHVLLYRPDHPGAGKNGYVAEHRVVWEEANGRRLEPGEHVFHLNGVPDDNRPENLVVIRRRKRPPGEQS
jgi:hypothetical protein